MSSSKLCLSCGHSSSWVIDNCNNVNILSSMNDITKDYINPRKLLLYFDLPNSLKDCNDETFHMVNASKVNENELKEFILDTSKSFHHYEMLAEFKEILCENEEKIISHKCVGIIFSFDCIDNSDQNPKICILQQDLIQSSPPIDNFLKLQTILSLFQKLHDFFTSKPCLFIIRHAVRLDYIDLEWVPNAKYPHDPPLHPDGVKQAKEVGKRMRHEKVDIIVSSPYFRATETAKYVAEAAQMKYSIEPGLSEYLSKVNRRGVPEFDPVRLEDVSYSDQYTPIFEKVTLETWSGIQQRAFDSLVELMKKYKRVCVVTHRSTTQAFLSKLYNETIKDNYAFTSVCSFEPKQDEPHFLPTRINSHYHLKTYIETPLHNPNYYISNNYMDMIRGPDGKILPSGYV
ncbi:Phosphoglycerate mutase [Entamoeba marina]